QGTGGTRELPSDALLLGTGRKANVEHLVQACRMPSTASPQVEPGMGPLRVTVEAIGSGRGPCQLSRDESRRMNTQPGPSGQPRPTACSDGRVSLTDDTG